MDTAGRSDATSRQYKYACILRYGVVDCIRKRVCRQEGGGCEERGWCVYSDADRKKVPKGRWRYAEGLTARGKQVRMPKMLAHPPREEDSRTRLYDAPIGNIGSRCPDMK